MIGEAAACAQIFARINVGLYSGATTDWICEIEYGRLCSARADRSRSSTGEATLSARRSLVSANQLILVQPSAESKAPRRSAASSYAPLSSVWEGTDGELLESIFSFYPTIPPEPILDATYNTGRIWKGSKRKVVSMDIDSQYKPMIVEDNRKMRGVPSNSFGTVVYDPPHVGPQGRDKSRKRFDVDFGARVECGKEQGWTLSYLYPPFLKQAKRVLKPQGLLLAKITDMVNNHRSKWPHCDFMRMAQEAGFSVCDLIVKVRVGPMMSTKWKEAHHARKRHCFWIICRNGEDCERQPIVAGKARPIG